MKHDIMLLYKMLLSSCVY